MARDILVIVHNHFDVTWRRCWDRPAEVGGTTVRSYVEIEALCIDAWLALADRGHTFSDGQAAIWRRYLDAHPQRRDEIRRHAASGNLDLLCAGETIQDTNLPTAEGLVRNFLVAWPLYRELVGDGHRALRIGWLADAFGSSPNYPQVLAGVGCDAAAHTSYRKCPEKVWVGIDGTMIDCPDHYPVAAGGAYEKHPPCAACRGAGCATCGGTGLRLVAGYDLDALAAQIRRAAALTEEDWAVVWVTTEELRPDPRVVDLVARIGAELPPGTRVRFANVADIVALDRPRMAAYRRTRDPATPTVDLNPAMPGCYVSRIRTKQRTRAVAYALTRAEAALADAAWRARAPHAPPADLARAWRLTVFNQFHDAITGTHIDSAYRELMDMLDEAEAVARRHAPSATRAPSPTFRPLAGDRGSLRLGALDVAFDRLGLTAITRGGVDVFGASQPPNRVSRPTRIAELTLEADFGDAWGKRLAELGGPAGDASCVQLGDFHEAVEVADDAIRWRGAYRGGDPKVRRLAWTTTVRASADGERLEFATEVDWDTASRRLRVVVPIAAPGDDALYEVPFGHVRRAWDWHKLDYSQWTADQREFPALHWVRKDVDARRGVALLNRGLPCNRWLPGRLDLSLVRSPEAAFCVVEPAYYEFWDIDGQRDAGAHRFAYALWPFADGLAVGDLVRAGYAYNDAALTPPFAIVGDVVVTAWKLAEDGRGWILRLQDASGVGGDIAIDLGAARTVQPSDLLERPTAPATTATRWAGRVHRHGIVTLRIA